MTTEATNTTATSSPLERGVRRLACLVAGHKFRVLRRMTEKARKVGCDRCGCAWAMHDSYQAFVPWDDDFEKLYAPGGPMDPRMWKERGWTK